MFNIYHNIPEWIIYTQHLTPREEGILLRLISKQFLDETPLPSDEESLKMLFRKLRIVSEDDKEIAYAMIKEFFQEVKGGYINTIYEGKIRDIAKKVNTASDRGKMGGRPKKGPQTHVNDEVWIKESRKKLNKKLNHETTNNEEITRENQENNNNGNNELQSNDSKEIGKTSKKLNKKLTPVSTYKNNDLEKLKKQTKEPKEQRTKEPKITTPKQSHFPKPDVFADVVQSLNFMKFIQEYPKQVQNAKKQEAAAEWRFGGHEMHMSAIMKNLNDRIAFSEWRDLIGTKGERYIPDPINFLKKRAYEEEVDRVLSAEEKQDELLNQLDF